MFARTDEHKALYNEAYSRLFPVDIFECATCYLIEFSSGCYLTQTKYDHVNRITNLFTATITSNTNQIKVPIKVP